MLRASALLLVCLSVPSSLVGQTVADRESVSRVVESLLAAVGLVGDEIPHSPGTWSLVIARYAKGDSREVPIRAMAGVPVVVSFTAKTENTFRAVLTAVSVEGGTECAGMIVMQIPDQGGGRKGVRK